MSPPTGQPEPQWLDKRVSETRSFIAVAKAKVAQQINDDQDVDLAAVERIHKLEVQLANLESFQRIRDMTRRPRPVEA